MALGLIEEVTITVGIVIAIAVTAFIVYILCTRRVGCCKSKPRGVRSPYDESIDQGPDVAVITDRDGNMVVIGGIREGAPGEFHWKPPAYKDIAELPSYEEAMVPATSPTPDDHTVETNTSTQECNTSEQQAHTSSEQAGSSAQKTNAPTQHATTSEILSTAKEVQPNTSPVLTGTTGVQESTLAVESGTPEAQPRTLRVHAGVLTQGDQSEQTNLTPRETHPYKDDTDSDTVKVTTSCDGGISNMGYNNDGDHDNDDTRETSNHGNIDRINDINCDITKDDNRKYRLKTDTSDELSLT